LRDYIQIKIKLNIHYFSCLQKIAVDFFSTTFKRIKK